MMSIGSGAIVSLRVVSLVVLIELYWKNAFLKPRWRNFVVAMMGRRSNSISKNKWFLLSGQYWLAVKFFFSGSLVGGVPLLLYSMFCVLDGKC